MLKVVETRSMLGYVVAEVDGSYGMILSNWQDSPQLSQNKKVIPILCYAGGGDDRGKESDCLSIASTCPLVLGMVLFTKKNGPLCVTILRSDSHLAAYHKKVGLLPRWQSFPAC